MTSYTAPVKCNVMTTGIRSSLLVDHVYKTVMDELETEEVIAQQNNTTPMISTTKHDYYKGQLNKYSIMFFLYYYCCYY